MICGRNFAFCNLMDPADVDLEGYAECNFAQKPVDLGGGKLEARNIWPEKTPPLRFRRCVLVNVQVPEGSDVGRDCFQVVVAIADDIPALSDMVYYVDVIAGNDKSDGLTPKTAWSSTKR